MSHMQAVERTVDLTDPEKNLIFNMPVEQARALVAAGNADAVRRIDGHFALVATEGQTVRMARSIGRPLRYFIAKRAEGPCLVAADRIDAIQRYLQQEGLADQFHPSYTRMVPAHYITEVALIGCPDPNPIYRRFFHPARNAAGTDLTAIGTAYIQALQHAIEKWLRFLAPRPAGERGRGDGERAQGIGVCFSGGIDSGSVFLVTYHTMLRLGMNPARLKAFTLAVDGGGADLDQARRFLDALGLGLFLEPIEALSADIDWREAVRVTEDYKPLDIQSATMALALCRGIRQRYPEWRYLIDGDGGDENLKDYPIEENPELTIRSVVNNLMLYQEGWGVDSIKHSLTYTGGLSRGYTRTYAPAALCGFDGFSPYTLPSVIAIAEGIPFAELTEGSHERLYDLKGEIVARGVEAVTGLKMPVFAKRRFQHGAAERPRALFPERETAYRRAFQELYE
jgi:asparagine synthase (glutamine-hydrolysing)